MKNVIKSLERMIILINQVENLIFYLLTILINSLLFILLKLIPILKMLKINCIKINLRSLGNLSMSNHKYSQNDDLVGHILNNCNPLIKMRKKIVKLVH